MLGTKSTDIVVVLDKSGSMIPTASDTIGGLNAFIKEQQDTPGQAWLTLHQFSTDFETTLKNERIAKVRPLTFSDYRPHGNTALYDAICKAIDQKGAELSALEESKRPDRVVVVIITDGEENSSREFNHTQAAARIKHQKEVYSWEFVFLGANIDAPKVGRDFGIPVDNCMTYAANQAGTTSAYASVSSNLIRFRTMEKSAVSFEAQDKKAQQEAGL